MRSKVAADLQERLATLRDTADGLRRDRSALLHKIRRSLAELRAGPTRLIQARRPAHSTGACSPTEDLADRFRLTPRETEVALLLADGGSNAAVARALSIRSADVGSSAQNRFRNMHGAWSAHRHVTAEG